MSNKEWKMEELPEDLKELWKNFRKGSTLGPNQVREVVETLEQISNDLTEALGEVEKQAAPVIVSKLARSIGRIEGLEIGLRPYANEEEK